MNCPSSWKQLLLSLANSKWLLLDRWQPHNWFVAVFYFDLNHDYIWNDWQVVISKCRELFNINRISGLSVDYYLHTAKIKVNTCMPKDYYGKDHRNNDRNSLIMSQKTAHFGLYFQAATMVRSSISILRNHLLVTLLKTLWLLHFLYYALC